MKINKRVCAKVNLNHIKDNFEGLAALTKCQSRLLAVIKADGYGHGAVEIAKVLEPQERLYGFAVATAEEAFELREKGIEKPILILGYTFPESYDLLVKYDIRPAVFREDSLEELAKAAKKAGRKLKIHIKVDTGMHRIGITPDEAGLFFVEKVLMYQDLEVEGMFTHFARADEVNKAAAYEQLNSFQKFTTQVETRFEIKIPYKHCANSAAILELPDSHMDMVRAGVALYGLWPSDEMKRETLALKPVLSLYSHIVYIKEISKGDAVGYGGTFVADSTMRIATIPVGYGDGYPRSLSSKGYVLIQGKKAPILGRVCMDQFMVDVTQIPEASMGDLVTLIGTDGKEQITMEELGDISGRFNYELACDLGKRIPRVYDSWQ